MFGPGFLEKASKKLETQKALAKVSADQTSSRKWQWDLIDDKSDHFYQEAPLQSTAAGVSATANYTSSHTRHNRNQVPINPPVQFRARAPQ